MQEYRGKHARSTPWVVPPSSSHYHSRHALRNRKKKRGWIIVCVVLCALVVLPFIYPLMLETDRVALASEDLPADIGHLRIVYLTDIHYGFFFSDGRLQSLINRINNLKPDLVLFGGGYATDNMSAINFFKKLPSIHARYQILGVIGDGDRGDTDTDLSLLTDAMRSAGVVPLVNTVARVRLGNSSIYVAGADDFRTGSPDVEGLAAQVSAEDYVIFLAHHPSLIPVAQAAVDRSGRLGWFDLALFGYTHGGQIAGLSSLLDIGADVADRYRSGWFLENRANILVSNGVGTSVIPARAFCPAQIHYIEVSAR